MHTLDVDSFCQGRRKMFLSVGARSGSLRHTPPEHFLFLDPLEAILSYFQSTIPLMKLPAEQLSYILTLIYIELRKTVS